MILITRPQRQAEELAEILENMNHECFIEPMLSINFVPPEWHQILSEPLQSFIATSKNAKRFIPHGQPLASIPRQGKNAYELYNWIIKNLDPAKGKITYLRGDAINFDMAGALRKKGFKVEEIISYQSVPAKDFSEAFMNNFHKLKTALFFSAKTAENFLNLASKNNLNLKKLQLLCISKEVAEIFTNHGLKTAIAKTPDLKGIINLADETY